MIRTLSSSDSYFYSGGVRIIGDYFYMAGYIKVDGVNGFYPVILKISKDGDVHKVVKSKTERSISGYSFYGDKYYNLFARDKKAYVDGDKTKGEYKFIDFAFTTNNGIVSTPSS